MAANLNSSEAALYPEGLAMVAAAKDAIPSAERDGAPGRRALRLIELCLDEPHIDAKALEAIAAPTLVMTADHDVVRAEHTLEIFRHVPNSQLVVFPDATHMLPFDDPPLFNATVERFFRSPFVKKDRIDDMLASLERMRP